MQDRKQHPLETQLLDIIQLKASDAEKNIKLKLCLSEMKECKDIPAPRVDVEDETMDEHDTPLQWAAYHGDVLCLESLMNAGARYDKQNTSGDTALHWAMFNQNYDCAELLLDAKANPNIVNDRQHTPLDDLLSNEPKKLQSLSSVRSLIEKGAMPHSKMDALVEFIQTSDLNNEDGYVILSLLTHHHEEYLDAHATSPMTDQQYANILDLLKKMPLPPSAKKINEELVSAIDIGIDARRQFPAVLINLIKTYDNPFYHMTAFFKPVELKKTSIDGQSNTTMASMKLD